jgi:tryptophanyl-tRNA synthetase
VIPEPVIPTVGARIMGLDDPTSKMSKSASSVRGHAVGLLDDPAEIERSFKRAVTDSSGEIPKNVYAIHELFRDKKSLDALYEEKKGKYKDLKEALLADIIAFITPLREKRKEFAKDRNAVLKILKEGGEKAKARASEKMKLVRKLVGVDF